MGCKVRDLKFYDLNFDEKIHFEANFLRMRIKTKIDVIKYL